MHSAYTQAALVVLLLFLAPFWAAAAEPGSRRLGETAYVVQETSQPALLHALMNASVSLLEFQIPEFTVVVAAWTYITQTAQLMLMRNFTVSSSAQPPTVFDFQYLERRVLLGDGATEVVFTIENITLANVRKNSFGIDFVQNTRGSSVMLRNVVLVETVCTAAPAVAIAGAMAQPSLAGHPPNSVQIVPNTCVQLPEGRRCFEDSLHFSYYAARAKGHKDGYTFVKRNTTRVCLSYVDPECLRLSGNDMDYCWMQQALKVQPWLQQGSKQAAQLSPGTKAGIAVAAGVVAAAAAGVLLWWCRRRRHTHKLPTAEDSMKMAGLQYDVSTNSKQSGSMYSCGPPSVVSIPRSSSITGGVQLGVLLGAGSFGRVYRGKWHSNDVAIKVMSTSPAELPRVLKEAEIMIGLEHDNIVRALHCMVVDKQAALHGSGMPTAAECKGSVSDSWQLRHGSHSSTPAASSGDTAAAQPQQHAAAAGSQCAAVKSQPLGHQPSSCSFGVAAKTLPHAAHQPGRPASQHQQQQGQDQQEQQQQHSQQQQQQSGSLFKFGSGSLGRLGKSGSLSNSSSKLAAAVRGLLHNSSDAAAVGAPAAAAAAAVDKDIAASNISKAPDTGQQQQQQQRQKRRDSKHVELPPSGKDELLTYPGSSAAERTPEREEVEVWLVMELCGCGNLKEAYGTPRDTMAMARLVSRLLEVAQGMAFLHAHRVLHGDLKAANVLLKSTIYSSFGHVSKISDFGLASRLLDGATHRSTQTTGTISHSAPEVLTTGRMSAAADVYSFGIMMWELFTASSAFKGHFGNVVQRVVAGERPPLPEEAPEEYTLLMTSCWCADPRQRPSFKQVVECLGLMLQSFCHLTQELAVLPEAAEAAGGEGTAAAAAAAGSGGGPGAVEGLTAKQQQQQQGVGGSGSGSERRRALAESRHVQDL
uniref:Protein kinase domain-containing protein n=1 Tax=Tetradesmus obliquus TaxID=3088 RepID=A0A383VPR0_TETOB|eukprot:jgi/Sobl393_1/16546/SZX66416.1